jgi:hypothetical protein
MSDRSAPPVAGLVEQIREQHRRILSDDRPGAVHHADQEAALIRMELTRRAHGGLAAALDRELAARGELVTAVRGLDVGRLRQAVQEMGAALGAVDRTLGLAEAAEQQAARA